VFDSGFRECASRSALGTIVQCRPFHHGEGPDQVSPASQEALLLLRKRRYESSRMMTVKLGARGRRGSWSPKSRQVGEPVSESRREEGDEFDSINVQNSRMTKFVSFPRRREEVLKFCSSEVLLCFQNATGNWKPAISHAVLSSHTK